MSMAAQFVIAKNKKPNKFLSRLGWIRKLRYISTVECYTMVRKKEITII
jgi:hypothetical protein